MKHLKISVLLFLVSIIYPQENDITFEHFGTKDGITHNYITSITQDDLGYIWFSTQFGLNKFDGYNFKSYTYDPKNKNTPRGNWVNFLIADSKGKIWILQGIGGVDCFDTHTESFDHFEYDENDPGSISEKFAINVHLDKWDNLWLMMSNTGINRFDRASQKFIKYSHDASNDSSVSSNRVLGVCSDTLNGNKYLWLAAGPFGLNRLNIESGEVKKYRWRDVKPDQKLYDFIDSIDSNKLIAASTKIGDAESIKENFSLSRKTEVLIVNSGEAVSQRSIDFGSISKGNRVIWEFDKTKSAFAGGEFRNRIQFDLIQLEEGDYRINYKTDSTHSFDKWYDKPPSNPELYGISLYEIDAEEKNMLVPLMNKIEKATSLSSDRTTDVERIGNNLWISTWGGGINKLDLSNGEFESFEERKKTNAASYYHRNIIKDTNERLWIIDRDYHLLCFDTKKKKYIDLVSDKYDLSTVIVNNLMEDSKGALWVASQKSGLYKIMIDSLRPSIKNYRNDKLNPKSISGNSISYLLQDKSGNIWVGTHGAGLNKFNEEKNKFNLITEGSKSDRSISDRFISSFAEDNKGNIWIATKNGGINKFIINENKIIKRIPGLTSNELQSTNTLYYDKHHYFYIGLSSGGIYKYNPEKKYAHKLNFGKFENILNNAPISSIIKDEEHNLWIGTYSFGLFKINEKNGKISRYLNSPDDSTSLLSNSVWTLFVDSRSDLWVGTSAGGISKYIKGSGKFLNYNDKPKDPYRFPNQTVECFFEDSKGRFWIGSFSAGLNLLDRSTHQFKYFTVKDGLPGNKITGIVEDDDGNLWLSTNNGISKFNPEKLTFRNFDYTDGLQDNEFSRGAYLRASGGQVFFGGEHGFNYFDPDDIHNNNTIPKINITAFKKYNEEIKFEKTLEKIEQIELSYNEDEISFEFVALDYTAPEKNIYAYKMQGFDNDWVYSGKRRYANYTNLFPGEYVFKVIGTNSDGVWNKEGASINIIVYPPFWETWWFYLVSTLLLFAAVFSIHRIIVNKKIRQLLEHERIRNNEREKVREELSRDFHDELGHKLTRISMYARNLKKKTAEKVPELYHELTKVNETSQSLYLGAKDLIWALNPGEDTLYDALIRLKDFGDDLFDKTEINFSSKGIKEEYKSIKLPMEWKRHLVLIFKESMNNILKYADCANVFLKMEMNEFNLKLVLSDDGKGFELNGESNGYGLNNIKKRAEKINGKVLIKSGYEKGTVVIFEANIPRLWD